MKGAGIYSLVMSFLTLFNLLSVPHLDIHHTACGYDSMNDTSCDYLEPAISVSAALSHSSSSSSTMLLTLLR